MLVYVDGSALSRYLVDLPGAAQWREWAAAHEHALVTTPLGLTELRLVAGTLDAAGRTRAYEVTERIAVVRFSDQTLATAAMARSVLSPFAALHLGTAATQPDVGAVATYDLRLASVAAIYGLSVLSPGYPDGWWQG
ncbi:PIN domain-containing protein [Pengzhenrongella sicca]|uniref:PIN domain-containing protein n=1 Tax=Pengzhenrongella sicca TaxID=2819238 RepID=A0A8A4ZE65_9MICO|nr:PIN domain-containing protein [Pengzhenrongella sicca]QTE29605.1 PIN domain-containing protein [Pengzhenrongella sicca]